MKSKKWKIGFEKILTFQNTFQEKLLIIAKGVTHPREISIAFSLEHFFRYIQLATKTSSNEIIDVIAVSETSKKKQVPIKDP